MSAYVGSSKNLKDLKDLTAQILTIHLVAGRLTTQGPSWGYLKVNFSETLTIFGDKRPRNGSKNGEMAPRTGTGCPHIGPFVVPHTAGSEDIQPDANRHRPTVGS